MSERQENSGIHGGLYTMIEVLPWLLKYLSHSDLRRLRFVDHGFHALVGTYLYEINNGLSSLPNEIIMEILQYLRARDKSRLARVSHRFYPLIMDTIVRENIRYKKSNLLHFAVRRNVKSLTRRIICMGGDINITAGYLRRSAVLPRVLSIAAYYGYEDMVDLLLKLGACPSGQGKDIPLGFAIAKRHERVALILLQSSVTINGDSHITAGKLLQEAAAAKMGSLVYHLLQRKSEFLARDIDTALYHVLLGDISKETILKRTLHHEVYDIVLMLLEHGADPSARPTSKVEPMLNTARLLSARHPDPRVRALLLDTTSKSCLRELIKSDSQIGRSWVVPPGKADAVPRISEPPDWYADRLLFARLGDFFEKSEDGSSSWVEDQDVTDDFLTRNEGMPNPRYTSTTVDLEDFLRTLRQPKVNEQRVGTETLPSSAFPQLGTATEVARQVVQGIWASPNPSIHTSYSPPVCVTAAKAKNMVPRKIARPTENFPQLAIPGTISIDIEAGAWANILKAQLTQNRQSEEFTSASKNESGANKSSSKSDKCKKKKAKWMPLPI